MKSQFLGRKNQDEAECVALRRRKDEERKVVL
jgi:hypothetical protein